MNNMFNIDPEDQLGIDLADAEVDLIEQLIAMRKARDLNQSDIARQIGVDRSVVTRFEAAINGQKRPNLATVRRYAEAVNAFIGYLVVPGHDYADLQAFVRNHLDQLECDSPVTDRGIRLVTQELHSAVQGPELRSTTPDWGARPKFTSKALTFSGRSSG